MPNKAIFLYGAGGHAKVIRDIVEASGGQVAGLVDDNPNLDRFMDLEVKHGMDGVNAVLVSIGINATRRKVVERLKRACPELAFGKAVHPTAIVSPHATVEEGTVVMQGAILQSGVRVGKHAIVNTGASVDHDCVLGDYTHVSPHATLCGEVVVGEGTWIGAGSVVIQGIRIGKNSLIGAGSVVCKDIPDGVLAYGNPCRVIRKIE